MNKLLTCAAALALGLASLPAGASTLTFGGTNVTGAGISTSAAGMVVQSFDSGILPSNYVVSGPGSIVQGSSLNVYKAPTDDTTKYLTTGVGSVTATTLSSNYLGFYWGSVDTWNTLTLTTSTGATEVYTGGTLAALGVLVNSDNSVYANFTADAGSYYTSAKFASTQNSFEIDNVATAAPEPASLAMIGSGLALGFSVMRRRKQATNNI